MKIKTLVFALLSCLCLHATAQENIVDRLNKTLGISLPAEFDAMVREYATNDTLMRTPIATTYTEQFIIEEMIQDWGISKQNQLIFMWSAIYEGLTNRLFFDFLKDEDKARSDEYFDHLEEINDTYDRYEKGFNEYLDRMSAKLEQQSADLDQQSADLDQQSADLDQQSADLDQQSAVLEQQLADLEQQSIENCTSFVNEDMARFYIKYVKKPYLFSKDELDFLREAAKIFIAGCKEYNIDYRAILLNELGDEKKVDDCLKFYGVE